MKWADRNKANKPASTLTSQHHIHDNDSNLHNKGYSAAKNQRLLRLVRQKRKNRKWQAVATLLSAVIVFVTMYFLVLPAITLTKKQQMLDCHYQPHVHDESCYSVNENGETVLICGSADWVIHEHNEDCYAQQPVLDEQGQAVLDENGEAKTEKVLVCTLPEIKAHKHTSQCYKTTKVLTCTQEEHTHDSSCYKEEVTGTKKVLTCGYKEGEKTGSHMETVTSTETVVDEDGNESQQEVTEEVEVPDYHHHDEGCYEEKEITEKQLVCGKAEHKHGKACYEEQKELICGEIELHQHTIDCYEKGPNGENPEKMGWVWYVKNENGNKVLEGDPTHLICGKLELLGHQHGADCIKEVEVEDTESKEAKSADTDIADIEPENTESGDSGEAQDTMEPGTDKSQYAAEPEKTENDGTDHKAETSNDSIDTQGKDNVYFSKSAGDMTVSVSAPVGAFPEGTTMEVTPVAKKKIIDSVTEAVGQEVKTLEAVDISFFNKDGSEIEPEKPIQVTMKSDKLAEDQSPVIVHVDDKGKAEVIDQLDAEDEVVFMAEEFSTYAVVYTVDFYYGDLEYHMEGGSQILLSKLFEVLEIEEKVDEVEDVEFSDPELVKVEKAGSDWKLISLKAFDTEEKLTVKMKDGRVMEIKVEDAQYDPRESATQYYYLSNDSTMGKVVLTNSSGTQGNDANNGYTSINTNGNSYRFAVPIANEGYRFVKWTNNGKDYTTYKAINNNNYDYASKAIQPNKTKTDHETNTFVANFEPIITSYSITYTVEGDGSVDKTSGTTTDAAGATATANEGYHFVGWKINGNIVSTATTFDLSLVNANTTVTAVFEANNDDTDGVTSFTYTVNDEDGGTIQLIDSSGKLSGSNNVGTTVTDGLSNSGENASRFASPVANEGYRFVNWMNGGVIYSQYLSNQPNENAIKPTLKEYKNGMYSTDTFVANFIPKDAYAVWLIAGEGGTIFNGDRLYTNSTEDLYIMSNGVLAKADEGYEFVKWIDAEGNDAGFDDRLRIDKDDIKGDTYFKAIFRKITDVNVYYTTNPLRGTVSTEHELVNLEAGANGSTAIPLSGYRFICWVNEQGEQVWIGDTHFMPEGEAQVREGATYTAIFEPNSYQNYLMTGVMYYDGESFSLEDCGYISSNNYTNTVNNRVVSMYVRENGRTPADLTAVAYEDFIFDHWLLNFQELEGVGETIPANYDLSSYLGGGDNYLVAVYKDNPNVTDHTITYKAIQGFNSDGSVIVGGGAVSRTSDTWHGGRYQGVIKGSNATAYNGYEFAGWVELTTDPGVIRPVTNNKTNELVPSGELAKDATYYAMFRKTTGASGLVGYNMNIHDVDVKWDGPRDFVMTSGAGAVMYYSNNNGNYYETDQYFWTSNAVPKADGYYFLGWFDKDRPSKWNEKKGDDNFYHGKEPELLERAKSHKLRFVFNGSAGGRYTLEAVWAGLDAESKRLPYDGKEHYLPAEMFVERGTLPETPRYDQELTSILNEGGYKLKNLTYQLIEQDGEVKENQPIENEFKRVQPGVYKVHVVATGEFLGKEFELTKDIYLIIYPADVIINKVWIDEDDKTGNRPDDLSLKMDREYTLSEEGILKDYSDRNLSATEIAGRSTNEPEWIDNHDNSWTKTYENVLVRPDVYEEMDQDSGFYRFFADEIVPEGYEQVGTPVRVVSNNNFLTEITITNKIKKTKLTFAKEDDKGNTLKGSVFELEMIKNARGNDPNEVISYMFTLGNHTEDLPNGYYKLTEKLAPEGYALLADPLYFKVWEGTIIWTDKNGNTSRMIETDEGVTEEVPIGLPDGVTFTEGTMTISIKNFKPANISIKKVAKGNSDTILSNAVFQLFVDSSTVDITQEPYKNVTGLETITDPDDSNISWNGAFITDGSIHEIKNLPDGAYVLKEVKMPSGYGKEFEDIAFTVKKGVVVFTDMDEVKMTKSDGSKYKVEEASGTMALFTVENTQGVELPSTGGSGTMPLYILGMILFLGSGFILIAKKYFQKGASQ